MMRRRDWASGCSMAVVGTVLSGAALAQQVSLPEIVVTSPSPILTRPERFGAAAGAETPVRGTLPVIEDAFAPVTVVTPDEIARETRRSLGDLLFTRPGLSASSYAPGASRPIVRGLDNFRVRIQENGIGAQDVSELGEDHGVPLDPLAADRIEVIRGPATLRYGSQAIGGVVSATNNRIPTFVPPEGVTGRMTGGLSSVDRGREGAASIDAGGGSVAIHADAFGRRADDYRTPLGIQRNSAVEAHGQSVGASVVGTSGFVGLAFQHFDALYGIPGGEAAESRTRIDLNQDKLSSKGEVRPDSGPIEAVRFFFGASRYKHHERGLDEDGADAVRATFRNREYEARIEAQHVPVFTGLGTLTGALGVQFGRRDIGTSGEAGTLLRPTETRTAAVYLFEELAVTDAFKLQAAGRVEGAGVRGTATAFPTDFLPAPDEPPESHRERRFVPASVSLGALHKLPWGMVASLNAQYVERAPASAELYSRGAHDATATFEIGNPDLKKEVARTVEAGIRRAEGPFRFDATGYYTRFSGFIYKRLTGITCGDEFSTCGTDTELQQIVYSQRNATFYGAEVTAQLDLVPIGPGFVGLDAQYDFVRARFADGTYVPRIPPHRAGAGLFYRDPNWFARLGFLHAFAHTELGQFETVTPDYTLLKAELSYRLKLDREAHGFTEVSFGLVGDNLLDDQVRNSASFKKDEVLLPGRNVRLFLSARF
ncbi:TonB-dependent receptor [Enterovirga aerilata]|uniref:TonB-dependent receptor n=1 Tax=Enterovirga aerilata TaxID=2730920 RepID=A0A849I1S5_9HYPH|nr:TonB-dependent receptor [Enterovirga sp. DB1703]NNM71311.1 TonB-dependent receptor [Enterovirga sp. DB1703]